jgi:tRNA-2-methylthio-N6-dimethylallyladenosine synthase
MALKYFIKTLGCQMNEHDSERIAGVLESAGYDCAQSEQQADIVVFNTCAIRENADNKFYGQLGRLKERKVKDKSLKIVVAGCLAQKDKEKILQKAPFVDLVLGTFNVPEIGHYLDDQDGPKCIVSDSSDPFDVDSYQEMPVKRASECSAWVTIQIGCNNSCTFCIVPTVRGPEVSRPVKEIIKEVKGLVKNGVYEITLLGQNVNSFGRDITLKIRQGVIDKALISYYAGDIYFNEVGKNSNKVMPLFPHLLRELGETGIKRIRFTSPHPKDLSVETLKAIKEVSAVCPQLHLPLQSGSNRILRLMQRGYTKEKYLEKLNVAKEMIPDLAVSTDIIVGFPSETEADFEQTLEVASLAKFDSAYTFIFSPRPFTKAAEMQNDFVDYDVAVDRLERLKTVTEKSALLNNLKLVGSIQEVLVEGSSKKYSNVLTGRTLQNKLVHFPKVKDVKNGSVVSVKITEGFAHYLKGDMLELLQAPRVLKKLPVKL